MVTRLNSNAYALECKYRDYGGGRNINASWSSADLDTIPIGNDYAVQNPEYYAVQNPEYVEHAGHNIEIFHSTIPTSSTIELSLTGPFLTDESHTIKVQGRDMAGLANHMTSDDFSVVFDVVRPVSLGELDVQLTVQSTHNGDGFYEIPHLYTLTGDYTVSMTIENVYTATDSNISTAINGSPLRFTVLPGAVDPSKCYYVVDTPASFPTQVVAGESSVFTV